MSGIQREPAIDKGNLQETSASHRSTCVTAANCHEICIMKKPSKTAAELEASIKVEMEDICDYPTDMVISVRPDGDSWKAVIMGGSGDDSERRQMIEQISARLKAEYDLKN